MDALRPQDTYDQVSEILNNYDQVSEILNNYSVAEAYLEARKQLGGDIVLHVDALNEEVSCSLRSRLLEQEDLPEYIRKEVSVKVQSPIPNYLSFWVVVDLEGQVVVTHYHKVYESPRFLTRPSKAQRKARR